MPSEVGRKAPAPVPQQGSKKTARCTERSHTSRCHSYITQRFPTYPFKNILRGVPLFSGGKTDIIGVQCAAKAVVYGGLAPYTGDGVCHHLVPRLHLFFCALMPLYTFSLEITTTFGWFLGNILRFLGPPIGREVSFFFGKYRRASSPAGDTKRGAGKAPLLKTDPSYSVREGAE